MFFQFTIPFFLSNKAYLLLPSLERRVVEETSLSVPVQPPVPGTDHLPFLPAKIVSFFESFFSQGTGILIFKTLSINSSFA